MDDTDESFASVFEEPENYRPKASETPPTSASYVCTNGCVVNMQIVGHHSLWAHVLYPSAICMTRYIELHPELVKGLNVLELGAGAGLPGLVSAVCGASFCLVTTDYPDEPLIANLRRNIRTNQIHPDRMQAEGFVWGTKIDRILAHMPEKRPAFNTILLADLVFNHSQHEAMLKSCEQALASNGVAVVFYSHHRPTPTLIEKDEAFLKLAEDRGWTCRKVVENKDAGLAFPADEGDVAIRGTVHGWLMTRPPPIQS